MAEGLDTDLLERLKNEDPSVPPLNSPLLNMHIIQLMNLRAQCGTTWENYVRWIQVLQPGVMSITNGWGKRLSVQAKKLQEKRKSLQKCAHRTPEKLDDWSNSVYMLPTVSGPRPNVQPQPSCFDVQVVKMENDQLVVENAQLKQQNQALSERPTPHEQTLQKRRESYMKDVSKEQRKSKATLESTNDTLASKRRKLEGECTKLRKECNVKAKQLTKTTASALNTNDLLTSKINELIQENTQLREYNATIKTELERTKNDVNCVRMMHVDKTGKTSYRPEVRACVYRLLQYHISFDNVGPVINTVLSMIGKSADHLPCGRTVGHFNDERLLLSQKQLEKLADKKDMTLGTDETPKNGDVYMTYTVHDQRDSYVLGLREMTSKSAEDTLTTLKDVLSDISEICDNNPDNETGNKILCQIRNTMSDRAATEALFSELLNDYRTKCLPLCNSGWDAFSPTAKEKLIHMNKFFCGLHLLVSMAETISASLKEFEDFHLEGKPVGAQTIPGVFTNADSGTIRLIRTCTKALAKGGDEKSGCHRAWKTFLRDEKVTKSYLQVFHGNRFNIIFLLGGCVHYLQDKVHHFLGVVNGLTNKLLKVVHADVQVPVYLAGCKLLGLLNKLVTAPLWRITEEKGHILDMCDRYTQLHAFLSECLEDDDKLHKFVKGEIAPFEDVLITKDEIFESVIKAGPHDDILISLCRFTFGALQQLVGRVITDYLPGGKYHELKDNKQFRDQTGSVPKHNKLPERVFGYLDFLLKKRPNVNEITNEAQVLFTFNRTAAYMDSISKEQLCKEIEEVKSKRKQLRAKSKAREQERHKALVLKQKEKQRKLEQAELNKVKAKENLTSVIIDAGLWQNRQTVEEKMSDCTSDAERSLAIRNQIQFRRKLLCQYLPADKGFTFSKGGVNKPWTVLRDHLYLFIDAALSVTEGQSVERTASDEPTVAMPLLVGKSIIHWFDEEDDTGKVIRFPYKGKVISQVPGFPDWYNVKYVDDPIVYSFRLINDYQEQNLEIVLN